MNNTALNSPTKKESAEDAMVGTAHKELDYLFWWALGATTMSQLRKTT
ncbi:MAG: hypothetical protein ACKPKO_62505 [Candidatus Fonsibacter sp.]